MNLLLTSIWDQSSSASYMVDSMHKDLSRSPINRALLQSFATQTYLHETILHLLMTQPPCQGSQCPAMSQRTSCAWRTTPGSTTAETTASSTLRPSPASTMRWVFVFPILSLTTINVASRLASLFSYASSASLHPRHSFSDLRSSKACELVSSSSVGCVGG